MIGELVKKYMKEILEAKIAIASSGKDCEDLKEFLAEAKNDGIISKADAKKYEKRIAQIAKFAEARKAAIQEDLSQDSLVRVPGKFSNLAGLKYSLAYNGLRYYALFENGQVDSISQTVFFEILDGNITLA